MERTGRTVADLRHRQDSTDDRLRKIEAAPKDAMAAEAEARVNADAAEAQARMTGIAAEARSRAEADALLASRQVIFTGTLSLPAGLAIAAGKTVRTVAVSGLKAGDNLNVTPKVAMPASVSLGEAYCLADNVLTVTLVAVGLVTLSAKVDVPIGVVALR